MLGIGPFPAAISKVVDPRANAPLVPTRAVVYATPSNVKEGIAILCSLSSVIFAGKSISVPVALISINEVVQAIFMV